MMQKILGHGAMHLTKVPAIWATKQMLKLRRLECNLTFHHFRPMNKFISTCKGHNLIDALMPSVKLKWNWPYLVRRLCWIMPLIAFCDNASYCDSAKLNDALVEKPCQACQNIRTCAVCGRVPINLRKDDLSHGFLLRQANTVMIDAVTRILTETVTAIEDYQCQYRVALNDLMAVMELSRNADESQQEFLTCEMLSARSKALELKKTLVELECYLESVSRLAHSAAETAHLATAELAGISLMERLNSSLLQVNAALTAKQLKAKTDEMENATNELHALLIIEAGEGLK